MKVLVCPLLLGAEYTSALAEHRLFKHEPHIAGLTVHVALCTLRPYINHQRIRHYDLILRMRII